MSKALKFSFILCCCLHTDKHLVIYQSIHIFGLVYSLSTSHFMSGVTHTETNVLFCSKLMCINFNILFWWQSLVIESQYSWIKTKSYNIFYLTEMFRQLRFVVFLSVYFKVSSDHSKRRKQFCVLIIPPLVERGLYCNHLVHTFTLS
jgi:hypothetical protein